MSTYKDKVDFYMKLMLKDILTDVAKNGLTQDQHFYISFNTNCTGVEMSTYLRAQYPDEMLIVLQNEFDHLIVDNTGFAVSLIFSGATENIYVSFNAIVTFVDPSANFSLTFEPKMDLFNANISEVKKPANIITFPKL